MIRNAQSNQNRANLALKRSIRFGLLAISLGTVLCASSAVSNDWSNEPPTELGISPSSKGYIASKRTGRLIGSEPELSVCINGDLRVGGKIKINPTISDADEDLIKHDAAWDSTKLDGTRNSVIWYRIKDGVETQIETENYELTLKSEDISTGTEIGFKIQAYTLTGFPDYNDTILTGRFDPNEPSTLNKIWKLDADGTISTLPATDECKVITTPIKQPVELIAKITVKTQGDYVPVLQKNSEIPSSYYNDVAVDITKEETLDLPATGGRKYFIRFYERVTRTDVTDIYAIPNSQDSAEFAAAKREFINHIKWKFVYPNGEVADVVFDRRDLSFTTQKTNDEGYLVYQNFDPDQIINGMDNNAKITVNSASNMAKSQQKSVMQIEYDDALLIKVPE